MNPMVSISVPTYERADFARICLQSLKDQTYANIEVCVFDNSASDAIRSIVDELADPRFSYHRNDAAISDIIVLNHRRCFRPREGKYLFVLTSDYALDPEAIERMVGYLENSKDSCGVTTGTRSLNLQSGKTALTADKLMNAEFFDATTDRIDSRKLLTAAFGSFSGVGLIYHSLIHADVLRMGLISDIYLSHACEHHLGLELLLIKPYFGYIADGLKVSIEHDQHYAEGDYRANTKFSQWLCREKFFVQHYAELVTRRYPLFRMRLGMMRGYFSAALSRHREDAFLEPLAAGARHAGLLAIAALALSVIGPLAMVRRQLFSRRRA